MLIVIKGFMKVKLYNTWSEMRNGEKPVAYIWLYLTTGKQTGLLLKKIDNMEISSALYLIRLDFRSNAPLCSSQVYRPLDSI